MSVIMAAYNCEQYVGEAVDSVLAQTYPDWELIVADDGSTDGTVDLVASRAASDPRIRLLRSEANTGCFPARNRALAACRGELIAILDADDLALPPRLARSVEKMVAEPELDLVGSLALIIDEEGAALGTRPPGNLSQERVRRLIAAGKTTFVHSSYVMRAQALRELGGYDEFFRYAGDQDLLLRFSARGPVGYIPEALAAYRHRPGQITLARRLEQAAYARTAYRRHLLLLQGEEIALAQEYERQLEAVKREKGMRSAAMYEHYANGLLYLSRRRPREAREQFARALRESPLSAKVWLRWLQAAAGALWRR